MGRHGLRTFSCFSLCTAFLAAAAQAQPTPWPPPAPMLAAADGATRPENVVVQSLRANALTAPYPITVDMEKGKIVLSGRVGTSAIHDAAVRTVIDLGYPFRDDLVIDTAEAHRVAFQQSPGVSQASYDSLAGSLPYLVYPPPLFGRVDDPFFGFEPPLVSFPPRGIRPAEAAPAATPRRPANGPVKGQIELTVDAAGQVFLRGVVASETDKRVIEQEARNTPGVTNLVSELQVVRPRSETPPPPPQPYRPEPPRAAPANPVTAPASPVPAPADRPAQAPKPASGTELAMARDGQKLTRRVADSLGRSPTLAGLPIAVTSRGDVVTLSGKLPTAYEAMLSYRAAEETPGVREIVDQLEFPVPDEDHPNPLPRKARPDDLEPYLTSQVRRHLGDLAHVDRVRSRGDLLEIRGTIADPGDKDRVLATLRSMPLLRDFRLDASFRPAP